MAITPQRFRDVFGSFPTSVAIITAMGEGGEPRGFTCNAVCAVSATPPLLLVCVDNNSQTLPAITSSESFVVNVLSDAGEEVSRAFAGKGDDKFAEVAWRRSEHAAGAPVLTEATIAYAECRVVETTQAGDHRIFIARVEAAEVFTRDPLLYHKGRYSSWQPRLALVR